MASLLVAHFESAAPMVPTLATHAASKSREIHVPEVILHVLPRLKSQDKDARGVCKKGDFAAVAGAAPSVCIVVALKAATAYAASAAISTAATSTGSCDLCCYIKLNYCRLGATGG